MIMRAYAHSFAEWRAAARDLLRRHIAPDRVQWQSQSAIADLFGDDPQLTGLSRSAASPFLKSASRPPSRPASLFASLPDLSPESHPESQPESQPQSQPRLQPALQPQSQPDSLLFSQPDSQPGAQPVSPPVPRPDSTPLQVTRDILAMFETAACYRADDRWAFLYRVLWRWSNGEHAVLSPADADGLRLHTMIKAVNRETQETNAALRFQERPAEQGAPRFLAWFDPVHDVLPRVAAHFARRMAQSSWLIATPQGTAMWDGKTLHAGPPAVGGPGELRESGEALWRAYFRSIFNTTGANAGVMDLPVPVRHWNSTPAGEGRPRAQAARIGVLPAAAIRIAALRPEPQREAPSALDQCRRCELWRQATQPVAGIGPEHARVMLVGEQPSDVEDIAGKPFVGPAGKLLNNALQQAGTERGAVYLTNAVKHFKSEPRGRRRLPKAPSQREVDSCGAWLDHELERVSPKVVVALGAAALKAVLKTGDAHLGELLNQPIAADGRWIVATYHPSHVLSLFRQEDRDAAMAAMVAGLRLAQQLAHKDVPAQAGSRQEERRLFA